MKTSRQLGLLSLVLFAGVGFTGIGCSKKSNTLDQKLNPQFESKVIYGTDGRLDVFEAERSLQILADSTVALVDNSDLSTNVTSGLTNLTTRNYGQSLNLCTTEKFREQNTAAFCSGSLISEDTIITAGHCITNQTSCDQTSFVFGFALTQQNALTPNSVPSTEVYRCKEIIKRELTNTGADYAVIKLDRVVPNHRPLRYRTSGEPQVNDPLVVIGHPTGLPTKITTGGVIRSTEQADFLITNLDTYGGNSGSAVFNANTKEIEGILVRGETDFVVRNGCTVSNICTEDGCRGEDVTRISVVRPFLPSQPPPVDPTPVDPIPVDPEPQTPQEVSFRIEESLRIPDNSPNGIISRLNVTEPLNGRKIRVTVDITHSYSGDLVLTIITPLNQKVVLQSRIGGSDDNIVKSFDLNDRAEFFQQAGEYQLLIQDRAFRDIGQINNWSIIYLP